MSQQLTNRRDFLRESSLLIGAGWAGLGSVSMLLAAEDKLARATPASSEPFVMGIIGTGGRGQAVAASFAGVAGVRLKYLCDVDDKMVEKAQATVAKKFEILQQNQKAKPKVAQTPGNSGIQQKPDPDAAKDQELPRPTSVKDFRRVLEDKEVHAVAIATPDHWHVPIAILALKAGKHVYVEKPCSHNPREGELLVEAARKYNRVVQHGTQRRSWPGIIQAVQAVRGGEIGNVHMARAWYLVDRKPIGRGKGVAVPEGFDYTMWQGPAPERPFRDNVHPYNWHWFWHWGTGELGNNGVHFLDIARWAMNVDYPKRVTSGGGRYFYSDDWETPDTQSAAFEFGDKMIVWEHRSCQPHGIDGISASCSFFGDKGTIICTRNGFKLLDKKDKVLSETDAPIDIDHDHMTNFVDAARNGRRPNADIEDGHKSTMLCHLGNIALRSGRTLNIDPKNGHILDDKATEDAYWGREYRPEWEPSV